MSLAWPYTVPRVPRWRGVVAMFAQSSSLLNRSTEHRLVGKVVSSWSHGLTREEQRQKRRKAQLGWGSIDLSCCPVMVEETEDNGCEVIIIKMTVK